MSFPTSVSTPHALPQVLYVCSAARCGSTILDMFLGGHPQAASLGEINLFNKALKLRQMCTCGVSLAECPAWARVFARLKRHTGVDVLADPYGYRLWNARARVVVDAEHQDAAFELRFKLRKAWLLARARLPAFIRHRTPLPPSLRETIDNKMTLYEAVAGCWGKQVIVDSSKNPWEAIELARRWPDRVKVVLLTRDGRGVYLSRRGSGFDRAECVDGWRTYYRRVLPLFARELPASSVLMLKYEDFARQPEEAGRRLCQSVGLDFHPAMLDLAAGERHMVNGNDTRFRPQQGIRLDERWQTELQGEELAYFNERGATLNGRLGYR